MRVKPIFNTKLRRNWTLLDNTAALGTKSASVKNRSEPINFGTRKALLGSAGPWVTIPILRTKGNLVVKKVFNNAKSSSYS